MNVKTVVVYKYETAVMFIYNCNIKNYNTNSYWQISQIFYALDKSLCLIYKGHFNKCKIVISHLKYFILSSNVSLFKCLLICIAYVF